MLIRTEPSHKLARRNEQHLQGQCKVLWRQRQGRMDPVGQRRERPCYSGCYNRIPEAGWLINQKSFSSHSGVQEAQNQCAGRFCVWGWPAFRFIHNHLSTVSSHGGEGKGVLWALFQKDTGPIHEAAPLKFPPPHTCAVSIRIRLTNFMGTQTLGQKQCTPKVRDLGQVGFLGKKFEGGGWRGPGKGTGAYTPAFRRNMSCFLS